MFSARHLPWFSLLLSCSVYNDALLGDSSSEVNGASGGTPSSSGSGSPALEQGGRSVSGGTSTIDPEQTGGDASGKPNNAGAGAGAGAVAGSGGASGVAGSGVGSGAGTSPNGGSVASMAGTNAGGMPSLPGGVDIIDDMEDGNFYLSPKPPRYGYWYVAGDMTVGGKLPAIAELVAPLVPARGASTSAVHFFASGFTNWGASVGLTFADASQKRTAYDSGDALGISFWVRGSVTDNTKLRVLFPIVGTDPSGKSCGGTGQGQCLDHFASQVSVSSDWQQVTVLFSSLHQAGWGVPLAAFDPKQMLGIEWTSAVALDVWIDDLALMRPE